MTDMTTMNSVSGVLNTATNRDSQASFQQRLVETLSPILGDSDAAQLESLIRQLPMVVGRTEQESLDLYADSLRTLLEKQAAFTGTAAAETAAHWMQSLQHQATNGQIAPQDVVTGVNNTLAHQFRSWFDKKLDTVDNSRPADFINKFRLGSQSTQAEQIAALDASTLTAATAEISKFVYALAQQMSSSEVRDSAISFLRNAFSNLGSVDINGLKNSDYLLTQESFSAAVTAQLVASLDSVDIKLSKSDAEVLAGKIAWIPGMSKQELTGALNDLAKQVKGQFANSYTTSGKDELQDVLNKVVKKLKNSPSSITLSSLFSSIAVRLVNTQVNTFYDNLHKVQKYQATQDQVDLIKQNTARDINLLFEKIVARKDIGTDFITRHQKMMENLSKLNTRLSKISEEEKKITTGADGKEHADVKAEHSLTARDLLSVIESSIGDRFDERVLFALNERRVNRLEKRDQQKEELQSYTARLKIFGEVQSQIHIKQSGSGTYGEGYNPESYKFNHTSFNYSTPEEFHKSPEFKHLSEVFRSDKGWGQPGPGKRANIYQDYIDFDAINRDKVNLSSVIESRNGTDVRFIFTKENVEKYIKPEFRHPSGGIQPSPEDVLKVTHRMFLRYEGIDAKNENYQNGEKSKKLSDFSSSVSDKSKLLNDEVQIKTTELNDTSSQYNSTVEAMNKFVQKYHSILQEILRAI
ncbi:virulence-associated V antigen [Vibrio harveyi]|uniref:virulence-associated V antigen n=1 Tax=Vibrio harveyi TaxID=669 RepID=UPI003CEABBB4